MIIKTDSNFKFVRAYVELLNLGFKEENRLNAIQIDLMTLILCTNKDIFKKNMDSLMQNLNIKKHGIWHNRREMERKGWIVDGLMHKKFTNIKKTIMDAISSPNDEKEILLNIKILYDRSSIPSL